MDIDDYIDLRSSADLFIDTKECKIYFKGEPLDFKGDWNFFNFICILANNIYEVVKYDKIFKFDIEKYKTDNEYMLSVRKQADFYYQKLFNIFLSNYKEEQKQLDMNAKKYLSDISVDANYFEKLVETQIKHFNNLGYSLVVQNFKWHPVQVAEDFFGFEKIEIKIDSEILTHPTIKDEPAFYKMSDSSTSSSFSSSAINLTIINRNNNNNFAILQSAVNTPTEPKNRKKKAETVKEKQQTKNSADIIGSLKLDDKKEVIIFTPTDSSKKAIKVKLESHLNADYQIFKEIYCKRNVIKDLDALYKRIKKYQGIKGDKGLQKCISDIRGAFKKQTKTETLLIPHIRAKSTCYNINKKFEILD